MYNCVNISCIVKNMGTWWTGGLRVVLSYE